MKPHSNNPSHFIPCYVWCGLNLYLEYVTKERILYIRLHAFCYATLTFS